MSGRTVEELAELIERHTGVDGEHPTAIGGLDLFRLSAPNEPIQIVYEPSLCLIAQGRKRVILADEIYIYDPAHFLLASVDLPVASQVIEASPQSPYLALRINLDAGQVGELAADAGLARPAGPPKNRGLAVSPVGPTLLDAVVRLLDLLDSPGDVGILAPLVLREITYRLLVGEQGPRLRQITAVDGQARRIVRAIQWLKGHFAEPFRIDILAREARMSPSSLHHQFKAVTAMSPLQYQKQLRLQEARRLMLGEGLDAATAGYRVGYESPSQFSREYRRLFGQPPRLDLASIRTASRL
ncbi:AraC family transcriptional regulator [Isosphaeraceae bacterium EP7]